MCSVKVKEALGLSLDDVLLVPKYSEVKSRLDVNISTKLTTNIKLGAPICSAAMDTVTEDELAILLSSKGGVGFLHRFATDEKIVSMVKSIKEVGELAVASIGIREDIVNWVGVLLNSGADAVSLDIAHGHTKEALKTVEILKGVFPSLQIVAGNVCTAGGVKDLINVGANAVKVGVGSGSLCSTRIVTGCGVPSFTALVECVEEANKYDIPVIMDGGIKSSGDIVKSIAAGASSCMLGLLFSRTKESPGQIQKINNVLYKEYHGMASYDAQVAFKGGLKKGTAAEGESMLVPVNGSASSVIDELCGGIRSGLSYCGALNFEELRKNAEFVTISNSAFVESKPFGLDMYRNIT